MIKGHFKYLKVSLIIAILPILNTPRFPKESIESIKQNNDIATWISAFELNNASTKSALPARL